MSDDGGVWDGSGAEAMGALPATWRENRRLLRESKRQLEEDRLQWSVARSTSPSMWTVTKTGDYTAHDVCLLVRGRTRGPARQLLVGVAAALRLHAREAVDHGDVVVCTRPGPVAPGDTVHITLNATTASSRTLIVTWFSSDGAAHRLVLDLPPPM